MFFAYPSLHLAEITMFLQEQSFHKELFHELHKHRDVCKVFCFNSFVLDVDEVHRSF